MNHKTNQISRYLWWGIDTPLKEPFRVLHANVNSTSSATNVDILVEGLAYQVPTGKRTKTVSFIQGAAAHTSQYIHYSDTQTGNVNAVVLWTAQQVDTQRNETVFISPYIPAGKWLVHHSGDASTHFISMTIIEEDA